MNCRYFGQCVLVMIWMMLLSLNAAWALQHEIDENIILSGEHGRVVISPFQISALSTPHSENAAHYTMYEIDYDELKRQIKIYQQIYVTGQLLHGYLMVKMKPKFVD